MAHFARINPLTYKVENVIVAEREFINTLPDKELWLQTSRNIYGGVYYDPETLLPAENQSEAIGDDEGRNRKNFAGIGFKYDVDLDAFIPVRPIVYPSWVFNSTKCLWEAPVAYPDDGKLYQWNEETTSWDPAPEE